MSRTGTLIVDARSPDSALTEARRLGLAVVDLDGTRGPAPVECLGSPVVRGDEWAQAFRLAQRIGALDEVSPALTGGLSLLVLLEVDLLYRLRAALARLRQLEALARLRPERPRLACGETAATAEVLRSLGLEVETATPTVDRRRPLRRAELRRRATDLGSSLVRAHGLERWAQLASDLPRLRADPRVSAPLDVLGVLEIPASYMAESLLPVLAEFDRAALLTTDARGVRFWMPDGPPALAFVSALPAALDRLVAAPRLRPLRGRVEALLRADSVSAPAWPLLAAPIRRLFTRRLPLALVEVEAARRLLGRLRPKAVVLGTDAHFVGRLFALLAARLGVASVVLQHGLPFSPWGYVPLHADRLAAWGPSSRDRLVELGLPRERIDCTGATRFDGLRPRPRLGPPEPTLLWLLDPHPPDELRRLYERITAALPAGWRLRLRAHPGDPNRAVIERMVAERPGVELAPVTETLADAVAGCDVAAMVPISAGLEVVALGRPFVLLRRDAFDEASAHFGTRALTDCALGVAASSEDLAALLAELRSGAPMRLPVEAIERHLGPLDGGSARRVADLLRRLAPGLPRRGVEDLGVP